MTAEQNTANFAGIRMEDSQLQQQIQKLASAPLVVMTKYQEPYDGLNPSVKVNRRPLGGLDGSNPVKMVELVKGPLERAFKDFAVVDGPSEVQLSGFKAGYMRMQYTLMTGEGKAFPTSSEIWIVPRGSFFFMIGVGMSQQPSEADRQELHTILQSIKIEE